MLEWRIYYADGSTFDSGQGDAHESPFERGVIAIVYPDSDIGRRVLSSFDDYYYRADQGLWYGCDAWATKWYLIRHAYVITAVRPGETLPTDQYRQIFNCAANDPDFPRKSGWARDEHRPPGE